MNSWQQILQNWRDYIFYTILYSTGEALLIYPIWNNVITRLFDGINSIEFFDAFLIVIFIRVLFKDIDNYNMIRIKLGELNNQNYANKLLYGILLNTSKIIMKQVLTKIITKSYNS